MNLISNQFQTIVTVIFIFCFIYRITMILKKMSDNSKKNFMVK